MKAKAVELAKDHGISERTVERSLAKADGKTPAPMRARNSSALELAKDVLHMMRAARESASELQRIEYTLEIDDELLAACRKTANAWNKLLARLEQKRAPTLPQDGRNGAGLNHSTPAPSVIRLKGCNIE